MSELEDDTQTRRSMDVGYIVPWLDHKGWRGNIRDALNSLLGVDKAYAVFEKAILHEHTNVFLAALAEMNMPLDNGDFTEKIPTTGSAIVISNHPFGGADTIALTGVCLKKRRDTLVLANAITAELPGTSQWTIDLQILGEGGATRANRRAMKEALAHLRAGGVLVVFPSGAVSRWRQELGCVADPDWSQHVARLASQTGAPVLPVRFFGRNPDWFELLGAVHPLLRSALIIRVYLASRGKTMRFRAGQLIDVSDLGERREAGEITAKLRAAVYEIREP